jgi:aryl-alcohol dehydrogenase-like predicted oxidoreductase
MVEKINSSTFPLRFQNIKYKTLGKTGFNVSVCGFGAYRVDFKINGHSEALEYAITRGINLIDTSANYSDGGSEILVGEVVDNLINKKTIQREDLTIITKGGYIQGRNYETAKQKEAAGKPYHEVVKCTPGLWHCIHPDFLNDQISASLKRLSLTHVDVYLLHNPEYFLTYSSINDLSELRKEYYIRIKKAFKFLEGEVERGRILFYGVSSNTFGEDESKRNFTSAEMLLNMANELSPKNHFAVIQLPLNLVEKGGMERKNQLNGSKSAIEFSYENKIGIIVNRPLNAIKGNKIIRLADFQVKENRTVEEIIPLLEEMSKRENEISEEFIERMDVDSNTKRELVDAMSLSEILKSSLKEFKSAHLFIETRKQYFVPRTNYAINEIYKYYPHFKGIADKLNYYITLVNIVLNSIESVLAKGSNEGNRIFHISVNKYLNDKAVNLPLSQKAVLLINSLPEVSCTLVGMRTKKYVDDIIKSIETPYSEHAYEYWQS